MEVLLGPGGATGLRASVIAEGRAAQEQACDKTPLGSNFSTGCPASKLGVCVVNLGRNVARLGAGWWRIGQVQRPAATLARPIRIRIRGAWAPTRSPPLAAKPACTVALAPVMMHGASTPGRTDGRDAVPLRRRLPPLCMPGISRGGRMLRRPSPVTHLQLGWLPPIAVGLAGPCQNASIRRTHLAPGSIAAVAGALHGTPDPQPAHRAAARSATWPHMACLHCRLSSDMPRWVMRNLGGAGWRAGLLRPAQALPGRLGAAPRRLLWCASDAAAMHAGAGRYKSVNVGSVQPPETDARMIFHLLPAVHARALSCLLSATDPLPVLPGSAGEARGLARRVQQRGAGCCATPAWRHLLLGAGSPLPLLSSIACTPAFPPAPTACKYRALSLPGHGKTASLQQALPRARPDSPRPCFLSPVDRPKALIVSSGTGLKCMLARLLPWVRQSPGLPSRRCRTVLAREQLCAASGSRAQSRGLAEPLRLPARPAFLTPPGLPTASPRLQPAIRACTSRASSVWWSLAPTLQAMSHQRSASLCVAVEMEEECCDNELLVDERNGSASSCQTVGGCVGSGYVGSDGSPPARTQHRRAPSCPAALMLHTSISSTSLARMDEGEEADTPASWSPALQVGAGQIAVSMRGALTPYSMPRAAPCRPRLCAAAKRLPVARGSHPGRVALGWGMRAAPMCGMGGDSTTATTTASFTFPLFRRTPWRRPADLSSQPPRSAPPPTLLCPRRPLWRPGSQPHACFRSCSCCSPRVEPSVRRRRRCC